MEQSKNQNSSNIDAINLIISNIQLLNQLAQQLNQCVEKIDCPGNDDQNRNQISDFIHKSSEMSHNINHMLQKLNENIASNRPLRLQSDRLMDHFISVLNQLQEAKRRAAFYEKSKIQNFSDNQQFNDEITFQLQQTQRMQNLEEIKERQQTLSSLEKEIDDINQIFTDLAQITHNQNEVVDTIEANIEISNIQMQQGNIQVTQANQYQMKSRQKKFVLAIFCIFILIIFLFIFWIFIRK